MVNDGPKVSASDPGFAPKVRHRDFCQETRGSGNYREQSERLRSSRMGEAGKAAGSTGASGLKRP